METILFFFRTREPERRVYASLDNIEIITEAESENDNSIYVAYFEAIDADWMDDNYFENGDLSDKPIEFNNEFKARLSILEYEFNSAVDPELANLSIDVIQSDTTIWFEFVFLESGERSIRQYVGLYTNEPFVRNFEYKLLSPQLSASLSNNFSMDEYTDATETEITDAIAQKVSGSVSVGVFDVGQGNCNALLDSNQVPLLYYDFGGGVLANKSTYPSPRPDFCFCAKPIIILSHWDWDHWSSALRSKTGSVLSSAQHATWIVPRQKLGVIHRSFISGLSNVLVWPNSLSQVLSGNLRVVKCTGGGRNHSGLAIDFKPAWAKSNGVLMTGDADYSYIPGANTKYDAVILPHHGGKMRYSSSIKNQSTIPKPTFAYKRLCYSYGLKNTFGHPHNSTLSDHVATNWNNLCRRDTSSSKNGSVLLEGNLKNLLEHIYDLADHSNPKYVHIISGDVHSAGYGRIEKESDDGIRKINEFISSPIVYKPVGKIFQLLLSWLSDKKSDIEGYDISVRPLGYGKKRAKVIYEKNFACFFKKDNLPLRAYYTFEHQTKPDLGHQPTRYFHPNGLQDQQIS